MRKIVKLTVCLAAMAILMSLFAGCSLGSQGIGVLDTDRLRNESPKIKQLDEQVMAKQKELTDQLEKDKASMKQDEFDKKLEATSKDFEAFRKQLEEQLVTDVRNAAGQVAKDKNLGVVVYKNSVVANGVDITDEVIKKLQ